MRHIGDRLQTNRVNKLLTLLLLLLVILLAVISLIGYLFVVNITNFSTKNRLQFEVSNNLIILDSTFRQNANIMVSEFFFYYQFVFGSYLTNIGFLTPANVNQMIFDFKNVTAAIGGINSYEFIYQRRANTNERWTRALQNYIIKTENSIEKIQDTAMLDLIQRIRTKLGLYDNTFKKLFVVDNVSYFSCSSLIHMRSKLLLDFMKQLRPVMNDKEPPFKVSFQIVLDIIVLYQTSVKSLNTIFSGIMEQVKESISKIREIIVGDNVVQYKKEFLLLSICLFLLALLYFSCALGVCRYFNFYLHRLLLTYKSLKEDEVVFNLEVNEQRIKVLSQYLFNEEELADAMNPTHNVNLKTTASIFTGLNTAGLKRLLVSKKGKPVKRKIRIYISRDFSYTSSKFFGLSSLGVLGLFALFYWLLYSTSQIINKTIMTEELYFNNVLKLIPVSNDFQAYNLFVIYGNYIKIDGKYLEDYKDDGAIQKFVSFWNENRATVRQLFDSQISGQLIDILWGDVCAKLKASKNYTIYSPACYKHPATSKGFLSFLELERDEIYAARQMVLKNTTFLNASKQAQIYPYINYFMSENSFRMQVLQDAITEFFIDTLFTVVLGQLSTSFTHIEARLTSISTAGAMMIVIAVIFVAAVTFRLISANTQVCRETFAIILPETIFNNPLIYNAFERHFIKQR